MTERFWSSLRPRLDDAGTLTEAAGHFARHFYDEPSSSAALVRVFITMRYAELPPGERSFADASLAGGAEAEHLSDETPVLVLLGSRGIEPDWNDRATSRDHRAIPLVSDAFVAEAPMIARLLRETGFSLRDSLKTNRQFVRNVEGRGNLFFVGDASTATDERGRRVIPAVDFVERFGIRTVYGSGAAYPTLGAFVTGIVFSRKLVLRADAESFVSLMQEFTRSTQALARPQTVFPARPGV